jgi:hypothetical protein
MSRYLTGEAELEPAEEKNRASERTIASPDRM